MASPPQQPHSLPRQRESRQSSSGPLNVRTAHIGPKVRSHSSQDPMDLPDRFKNEEEDDTDDGTGVGGDDMPFAQQSVYGMLAATQSKTNFLNRFEQESGSDSEINDKADTRRSDGGSRSVPSKSDTKRKSGYQARNTEGDLKGHRKRLSERGGKLVRSFLRPVREQAESHIQDLMTQSQILLPPQEGATTQETFRTDAPILDRKLQAMARAAMESSTTSSGARRSREGGRTSSDSLREKGSQSLAQVIANIFQFEEPEEVMSEYRCWYLQNVLLQGLMYVTNKHICFYSYLPKKNNTLLKSGHLGKQGRHSYGYRRYWFVLKGDIFSYYKGSAEPYFPIGSVDLRYAISADLSKEKAAAEATTDFTITTSSRVYQYRADTPESAREWVKQLQKVIFRSHNDSDSVKISLPVANILDVEQTSVVEFAETIQLRVLADDETFAVDEYFFTFFNSGRDVLNLIKNLTDANRAKQSLSGSGTSAEEKNLTSHHGGNLSMEQSSHPKSQRRKLEYAQGGQPAGGLASPRVSGELSHINRSHEHTKSGRGRKNICATSQRSTSEPPSPSPSPPEVGESTESFVTTSDLATGSSADGAVVDDPMSASQMLTGDSVFRGPTLSMPQSRGISSGTALDRIRKEPEQCSRESSSERAGTERSGKEAVELSKRQHRPDLSRQESGGSNRTAGIEDIKVQAAEAAAPGLLVRGISTPLQHVAGMVRSSGKRMGSYLSSSPKTYIDNWSAAIVGGKRHYTDVEGLAPDDSIQEPEQDMDIAEHERRFQDHFGLPQSEKLLSVFYCWLHKTVPLYGKIYMGVRRFCFRSLWYGTNTKLVIPYKDILNVQKQRGFRWGYPGMVLVIRGYEELFFDFPSVGLRDDAVVTVLRSLETLQAAAGSMILTQEEQQDAEDAAAENKLLEAARKDGFANHDRQLQRHVHQIASDDPSILFDDPSASVLDFKPKEPMRITCLTIGSRGDVQPYIALCKGLQAEGHICKIATHLEFKSWVEKHGIEFAEVTGDPAELMRVCVENGMFTPSFFMEVNSTFRVWLDDLLQTAWNACEGSDLLIESPSAMCGIHIAEALEIPYFRAFTMPWTRTRAYPHAFAVPNSKLGGGYNYMTYTLFDNIFWQAIANQINRWRGKTLELGPTSLDKLQQNKVPFLYNFSPSVVVPPLDFSDWIKVTGYWFLDEGEEWEPPKKLAEFIKKARDDKQKLVYIGFGSVTVSDSRQLMQHVVDAVVKADVRCILAKGWSDRYDKEDPGALPIDLPSCIHQIRSAPHDWLFRQVDAVVHHGGAGTTGASLRAGKPTIIKPFFGDQFFFATRVEDLGVGQYLQKVTANQLGKALWIATHDARMRKKAAALGESIRAENGVQTAIKAIYRDLDYAKSLIKKRGPKSAAFNGSEEDILSEDTEEMWTFVEKDSDADPIGSLATGSGTGVTATR